MRTESNNMGKYYPDEYDPLVSDIKAGLEIALYWEDIGVSGPDSGDPEAPSRNEISNENFVGVNEDLLWLDKLVVAAIRDIDDVSTVPTDSGELPLLYSWYRYGRATPIGRIKPGNLEPGRLDQRASGDPHRSSYDDSYPSPEDFAHFFQAKIREMNAFGSDLYGFLEQDYRDGPGIIRDIYTANLRTQRALFEIYSLDAGSILDEETAIELVDLHSDAITDLERSMYRMDYINEEVTNHVSNYLDCLRDLLLGMQSYNDIVRHSQSRLFRKFVTEYHGSVWMWVARIASSQTVNNEKEGANDLKDDNREFISNNKRYWKNQVQSLEMSIESAELTPSIHDFGKQLDDRTKELMEPLESSFLE